MGRCPETGAAQAAASYRADLVGDLFLGRGTTALACVELGRRFRGGDRSPTYVGIAQERVAMALDQEPTA